MADTSIASESATGLSVECRMEAQSGYRLGDPVIVTGTLRNTGHADLWILRRNTFLQPHGGDCALVTRDGAPVPRAGIGVFHAVPSAESYLRIAAGESAQAQVNLSEAYAIEAGGDYHASFRFPLLGIVDEGHAEPPRNPDRLKLVVITSNEVSFRIDGSGAAPSVATAEPVSALSGATSGSYPVEPKRPLFSGLSEQEQKDWFDAHRTAYKQIVGSIKSIETNHDEFLYRKWFEYPGVQQKPKVLATLKSMADWMSTQSIFYQKSEQNCQFDWMAWTRLGSRGLINLCSGAFSDFKLVMNSMTGDKQWARAFVLIHEISHATASTNDIWYSWTMCMTLPHSWPEQAASNATSYALFAMQANPSQGYEPKGTFDFKTGDQISLIANNGAYLANTWYVSGGDYIAATAAKYRFIDTDFTVTVHDKDTSRIYLQLSYNGVYLHDTGRYLRHGPTSPDDSCVFQVGEFENHSGDTLLVLQSYTGKILTQIDDSYKCVVAKDDSVNQWCLFKLVRVNG